jgi:toxin ParE1/3/4
VALKIVWSEEALEDIESIAEYIEKDSPFYAKSVVTTFFEKAETLKEFALSGRIVPELNDTTIREIFVYSYRLIYQIENDTIIFIAVVHGKRLPENHQMPK